YLPFQVTFTKISYRVATADNTGSLYDVGIYDTTGALLANIGATAGTTFCPANNTNQTASILQGGGSGVALAAGKYYTAWTGNAATCVLTGVASNWTFLANTSSITTSG